MMNFFSIFLFFYYNSDGKKGKFWNIDWICLWILDFILVVKRLGVILFVYVNIFVVMSCWGGRGCFV